MVSSMNIGAVAGFEGAKVPSKGAANTANNAEQIGQKDVVEEFLDYVNMNPIERIRKAYLEEQNLIEDELASLSPEERVKIEEGLRQRIEQQLTGNTAPAGKVLNVNI